MIKISFKLLLAFSIVSSYVIADDFKAKAKFKPQYPKSAYVKRISGYAIVEFVINEKRRTVNLLIYESYPGMRIEHSYKYIFRHWCLIKVDSVIDLKSGNFVLK